MVGVKYYGISISIREHAYYSCNRLGSKLVEHNLLFSQPDNRDFEVAKNPKIYYLFDIHGRINSFEVTIEREPIQVTNTKISAPLSDTIIIAVSRLVDDALTGTREPSHSAIEFQIERSGLIEGDPKTQGQPVGKAKRINRTLSWGLENNPEAGELLVSNLISLIKGCGGFRETSPNYVGKEPIIDAVDAFKAEGYELTSEGELNPILLDNLSGADLITALEAYIRRAKRGAHDAALVTGTGKDLLEATAVYILLERWGSYPTSSNFPTLLGQAFTALELATPQDPKLPDEPPQRRLERALYELGCSVNHLRNKEGTGHGRPWLPSVSESEAKVAIEIIGGIAERLLFAHKEKQ